MIDYSSLKTAADKFAALKEAAGKKPTPKINPQIYYQFSNKFSHFLDTNRYYTVDTYITNLISKNGKLITSDFSVTLIDVGENSDSISYIESDRLIKMFQEDNTVKEKNNLTFSTWLMDSSKNPEFWKQNRTEMKAGRFIKRLFNFGDKTCEEFANLYKSYNDSFNYEFQIVGGQDIIKYYNKDNYDIVNANSSLAKSCMAFSTKDEQYMGTSGIETFADRLQFYASNPNCGLLLLKNKNSKKIKGRCLVWKTKTGEIYLDRVYVDFESDFFLYKKYATDNNYYSHVLNNKPKILEIESNDKIKELFGYRTTRRREWRQLCRPSVGQKIRSTPYLDSLVYDSINNKINRK
jgi:hypothetical protein